MLYDVSLWFCFIPFARPDIACRVEALSVEDAALLVLRRSGWTSAAYVSVWAVDWEAAASLGTVARAWGPVEREVSDGTS